MVGPLAVLLTVQRRTNTVNSLGETGATWETAQVLTGLLSPASASQQYVAATRGQRVTHSAVLPRGTDVRTGDRLKLSDDSTLAVTEVKDTLRYTLVDLVADRE